MTFRTCFTWYGLANDPRGCRFKILFNVWLGENMMTAFHSLGKAKGFKEGSQIFEPDVCVCITLKNSQKKLLAHLLPLCRVGRSS